MNDWSDLRLMQINLRDGARAQYANTRWFPNSPPHNKARNQGLSLSLSHTHTHSLSLSLKRTICLRKQESRRTYIPGITMNAGALGTRRALKNFFSKRYIWNCFGRAMKTYWYVQQHMYSVTIFPDLRTPPYRTRWSCTQGARMYFIGSPEASISRSAWFMTAKFISPSSSSFEGGIKSERRENWPQGGRRPRNAGIRKNIHSKFNASSERFAYHQTSKWYIFFHLFSLNLLG